MSFFTEEINIVKHNYYYLVQKKQFGIVKYLSKSSSWCFDKFFACKVLTLEDAEENYEIHLAYIERSKPIKIKPPVVIKKLK